MNPQTLATIIDNTTEVGSSLIKDFVVSRRERQAREEKIEMEKDLARIRAQGPNTDADVAQAAGEAQVSLGDPLQEAEDLADQYSSLLEEAREQEDCGMCEMLIEAISQRPLSVQQKALPELRVLKQKADSGASTEELKQYIRETEVLKDVMKEETAKRSQQNARRSDSGGSRQRTLS